MTNFEEQIKQAAEKSVLKIVSEGGWVQPDYANRFNIPKTFMQDVWALVDQEKVKGLLVGRVEAELADRIVNAIAAELATDIKQILGVPERREAIRALARQHMESIMKAGVS